MSQTPQTRHWPQKLLAALLQADRKIPPRSDQEVAAEVARNYRWNFAANMLDAGAFWFGMSFMSASTIIPLYVSKLTPSPLAIGLVAVIGQGAWFLPQILTANAVERLPLKKPAVINLGFFLERLPTWLLVVSALVAVQAPQLALLIFFLGYAWRGLGSGAVATAWQDLLARCFPVARRGSFFGISNFVGAAMGAAGALLSVWILDTFSFSTDFVWLFAIAAAAMTASWLFLSFTREPEQPADPPQQNNREFLSKLPDLLRRDRNFRRYLVARSLLALGGIGVGFITVSAVQRWQVPDSQVGFYTAAFWVGQMIGYLSFGFLADRFGHKLCLELGALALALACVLAWLAPSPEWMLLVFVLSGINLSAVIASGILVALEFSTPERRPTYAGLANTMAGIASMLAPLLGAWLASIGYGWLFGLGAAVNLAAFGTLHWWVREPRWMPAVEL